MLNLTPKQFFEKLDYSKLDENTAQEIRSFVNSEEYKYLELSNELDEFKKVVELVEENFPEALGLPTKEQIAKAEADELAKKEKAIQQTIDAEKVAISPVLEAEQKRIFEEVQREAQEEEQEAKDAERVARITSKLKVLDEATTKSVEATAEVTKLEEKVENLTNRLELVKEMSADEPKNKGLKERIELVSEMLSEAKEELESSKKKYSLGGFIIGLAIGAVGMNQYTKVAKVEKPHVEIAKTSKSSLIDVSNLPSKIRFYDPTKVDGKEVWDIKYRIYESFNGKTDKWEKITEQKFNEYNGLGTDDEALYKRKKKSEGGKFVYYLTEKGKKLEKGGAVGKTKGNAGLKGKFFWQVYQGAKDTHSFAYDRLSQETFELELAESKANPLLEIEKELPNEWVFRRKSDGYRIAYMLKEIYEDGGEVDALEVGDTIMYSFGHSNDNHPIKGEVESIEGNNVFIKGDEPRSLSIDKSLIQKIVSKYDETDTYPEIISWRLGKELAGKKYYYAFIKGDFFSTEEDNIFMIGETPSYKDKGLVFDIDAEHFMDTKSRQSFQKEMTELFPELPKHVIIQSTYEQGGEISDEKLDEVFKHYIMASLWSSTDENDEPFDSNYSIDDMDSWNANNVKDRVRQFLVDNADDLKASGLSDEQIGHDLWLTQVGHGAGFWDRGLDKELGERLSRASEKLGRSANMYAEDGKIFIDGMNYEYKDGGAVGENDRMYNFLKDDLEKLEKAINDGDKGETDRFFSYWNIHLKSLAPQKGSDRMYNFLKDDLVKLEKAIDENDKEEIDRFFSYWNTHLKSLKYAKGGEVEEGDKVTITTSSLGKAYLGMNGEVMPRKLLNGKYSIKLDNGMTMAFSKDEFKHNSINPKYDKGGEVNSKYLDTISADKKTKILKNIANHYGISVADAEEEVKDADAEMLYEYIANDPSLRMDVYNDFKNNKYKEGGEITKKKVPVKYIGEDDWHRRLYKSEKGTTLADVDGQLHYITDEGEPLSPAHGFEKVDPIGEPSEAEKFSYMMLSRLQSDVEYYLGHGNRNERHLRGESVDAHIAEMKRLWNSLKVKPEWLSMEDILEYEKNMKSSSDKVDGEVTTLYISDARPLSTQLEELTGDSWNTGDFINTNGDTKNLSTLTPFKHIKSGKVFQAIKVEDVASKISSGEMFSKYGLSILNNYADIDEVRAHGKKIKESGIPFAILKDKDTYYIFSQEKKQSVPEGFTKFKNGGKIEGLNFKLSPSTLNLQLGKYGYDDYASRRVKDWGVDDFNSYVKDMSDSSGNLAESEKTPLLSKIFIKGNYTKVPTGANNNKNYKQFGSSGSMMYDIWEEIVKQNNLTPKHEDEIIKEPKPTFTAEEQKEVDDYNKLWESLPDNVRWSKGSPLTDKMRKRNSELEGKLNLIANHEGKEMIYLKGGNLKSKGIVVGSWLQNKKTKSIVKVWNHNSASNEIQVQDIYGSKEHKWFSVNEWKVIPQPTKELERIKGVWAEQGHDFKYAKGGGIFSTSEHYHTPSQSIITFDKKTGVVKKIREWDGAQKKEITIDGILYRKNNVYGTWNSVLGNDILSKQTIAKNYTFEDGGSVGAKIRFTENDYQKLVGDATNDYPFYSTKEGDFWIIKKEATDNEVAKFNKDKQELLIGSDTDLREWLTKNSFKYENGGGITTTTTTYEELMSFHDVKDDFYFKKKYSDGKTQSSWMKPALDYYNKVKSYLSAERNKENPDAEKLEFLKKQKEALAFLDTDFHKETIRRGYENGGKVESKTHIVVNGNKFYLTKGDHYHFFMSNNPDKKGEAYHIGQIRGESYYDAVSKWLEGTSIIDGMEFKTSMKDGGGILKKLSDFDRDAFKKFYLENEKANNHLANAKLLVGYFGTAEEKKAVNEYVHKHNMGKDDADEYNATLRLSNKYYKKLFGEGFGNNYNITFEKPDSEMAWKETINAETEDEAKAKFKLSHPTGRILTIGESFKDGGDLSIDADAFEKKMKPLMRQGDWHFIGDIVNGRKVRMKFFGGTKEVYVQIFTIDDQAGRMPRNYSTPKDTLEMIMSNFR